MTGRQIEALLRDLLDQVGGRGFVSRRRESEGEVITLAPANPRAARIEAYVEDDTAMISVEIGKKVVIEVFGSKSESPIRSLQTICEAVLAGQLEEEVWEAGAVITKSIGKITYGGRSHTYRWFGGGLSLGKTVRRQIRYEAYVPTSTTKD